MGQKVKKHYDSEFQQKQIKKRSKLIKMKKNIGEFFKENTVVDLLPHN